jgi:hypothetical protein
MEEGRLRSSVALLITRKTEEADKSWEQVLRKIWKMGEKITVKSEGYRLVG